MLLADGDFIEKYFRGQLHPWHPIGPSLKAIKYEEINCVYEQRSFVQVEHKHMKLSLLQR